MDPVTLGVIGVGSLGAGVLAYLAYKWVANASQTTMPAWAPPSIRDTAGWSDRLVAADGTASALDAWRQRIGGDDSKEALQAAEAASKADDSWWGWFRDTGAAIVEAPGDVLDAVTGAGDAAALSVDEGMQKLIKLVGIGIGVAVGAVALVAIGGTVALVATVL